MKVLVLQDFARYEANLVLGFGESLPAASQSNLGAVGDTDTRFACSMTLLANLQRAQDMRAVKALTVCHG